MSKRKHLEKLVRSVVFQGVQLAAFDRLLLLHAVLCSPDREQLVAVLRQSGTADFTACMNALDERGVESAMASVLLDLAEQVYGGESVPLFEPGPIRALYSWHDLDSLRIELHGWLERASGPALLQAFEQRAQRGELSAETEQEVREILRHAMGLRA